jgi:hypothetical protein
MVTKAHLDSTSP